MKIISKSIVLQIITLVLFSKSIYAQVYHPSGTKTNTTNSNKKSETIPKSQTSSVKTSLLLLPNLDCSISLDGKSLGKTKANVPLKVSVEIGEHFIVCTSTDGKTVLKKTIEVSTQVQKIIDLDLIIIRKVNEEEANMNVATQKLRVELAKWDKELKDGDWYDWESIDLSKIQEYVFEGADVNTKSKDGTSLLHLSVIKNNDYLVHHLVDKGINVNLKDKDGLTPLHSAAAYGHFNLVDYLIGKGADVNSKTKNGETPLHVSAHNGTISCASILLKKGANVNAKNFVELTPLDLVAFSSLRLEASIVSQMSKLLVSYGGTSDNIIKK